MCIWLFQKQIRTKFWSKKKKKEKPILFSQFEKQTSMAALSLHKILNYFFFVIFEILLLFYLTRTRRCRCQHGVVFLTFLFFAQNELKLKLKKVWFFSFMKLETGGGEEKVKRRIGSFCFYCWKLFFCRVSHFFFVLQEF